MTGMTPAWLTLSGMYVELPPNILRPTIRRAYCTGIRRCACSTKMTAAMIDQADDQDDAEDPPALRLLHGPQRGREAGDDLGEDHQRHAVADAALGDQLAEPHDHGGAGGHGDDHDQEGRGAVVVQQASRLQPWSRLPERASATMPVAWRTREAERQVAGVLGDLGLPGLALLLQRLEPRDHHDEQLQDDARRDVRHDPQREDRQLEQRATGEQVDQVVEPGAVAFLGDVDTGCGRWRRRRPGSGSGDPSRKITMISRTNSSLRRRSGVRKAFANALSTRSSFSKREAAPATHSQGPGEA